MCRSLEKLLLWNQYSVFNSVLAAVTLSGILKENQKLGVTFDSDELGIIHFLNILKLSGNRERSVDERPGKTKKDAGQRLLLCL